jgi:prepilin-type processing-associated H-X9-DG protein
MLLPALNRAREAAHKINCAGASNQIGQMLQLYRTDNNEFLPFMFDYTSGTKWWYDLLSPQYIGAGQFKKLAACQGKPQRTYSYAYGVNTKMMGGLQANGTIISFYGIKCIQVKKPSMTFLTMDGKQNYGGIDSKSRTDPNYAYCSVEFAHANGANIGFVDGHVDWKIKRPGGYTTDDIAMQNSMTMYE